MRARILLATLVAAIIVCGALGPPSVAGEIAFSKIERDHFRALSVATDRGAASQAPLEVHLALIGDASDTDLSEAWAWLAQHAGVRVVLDPEGAPVYLTRHDLTATSGRATLGATVPGGIAIEVRTDRLTPCVAAHETLHLLGLRHVEDDRNIMSPHCRGGLQDTTLVPEQLAQLDGIQQIRATFATGVHTWAFRTP